MFCGERIPYILEVICMKKYNYIVSVVMLLLSGYIFYESSGYTIGSSAQKNPAVWPCILDGALALLSVAHRNGAKKRTR